VRSEAVCTALQALVGCAGAAPTGNCASGALGAASGVVLNNLVDALTNPERDAAGDIIPPTHEDQQARTALIATLTGAAVTQVDVQRSLL
jgi:filamentous hemagglutinin